MDEKQALAEQARALEKDRLKASSRRTLNKLGYSCKQATRIHRGEVDPFSLAKNRHGRAGR